MMLERNPDHASDIRKLLIDQFKDKPIIEAILASYIKQVQDLEDALFQVLNDRWLSTAEGAQLDMLGEILGEAREGRDDTDYLQALNARIKINTGSGRVEDIIAVIKGVIGPYDVHVQEYFPAAFIAAIQDPVPVTLDFFRLGVFVRSVAPAGVLAHTSYYPANPFSFDSGLGYDQGHYGDAI